MVECYSDTRQNKIFTYETKCTELEIRKVCEMNQTHKGKQLHFTIIVIED